MCAVRVIVILPNRMKYYNDTDTFMMDDQCRLSPLPLATRVARGIFYLTLKNFN